MLCIFVLGLAFGNGIFPLVTGITLYSNETHMQASGFTLVCDVGGTISTSVSVDDPSGSTVGACLAPPGVCGSNDGNDVVRDVTGGTVSVTIKSANIHTTNYVGSWTCTDGINSATFTINEIVTYTRITISPKTATFGDKVTIKMDCVYPYPNIRIDYVKEFDTDSVLSSESEVKFTNGTALNCPVVDSRAISVSGTFTLKDTNLKESAKIKATAMFGTSSATYTISEFTLISDCTGSFHCGFWLLMLVVASSITICILIQLKVKIFGGFSIVKIIIIVIFSVVAIGIGLGLGLGLRKGGGNCLDCGATIGISISLGVALSVIQFIVIIKCDKGKGCDGNSKGETDRSNGDRARTPASTTGINLETKKN